MTPEPDGEEPTPWAHYGRTCKRHGLPLAEISRAGIDTRTGMRLNDLLRCPAGRGHNVGPGEFDVVDLNTGRVEHEETGNP